jgi:hypothetical protein
VLSRLIPGGLARQRHQEWRTAERHTDEGIDRQIPKTLSQLVGATGLRSKDSPSATAIASRCWLSANDSLSTIALWNSPWPPGGDHLRQYREPDCGLTGKRHVVGVFTELTDVVLHPSERRLLIHKPVVSNRPSSSMKVERVGPPVSAVTRLPPPGSRCLAVGPKSNEGASRSWPGGCSQTGIRRLANAPSRAMPAAKCPAQPNRYQGFHRCDRWSLPSIIQSRGGSRGDGDFVAGEQY